MIIVDRQFVTFVLVEWFLASTRHSGGDLYDISENSENGKKYKEKV